MVDLKDIMLTAHSLRKPLPPDILAMLPPSMLRKKKRSLKPKNLPAIRDLNLFRSNLTRSLHPAVVAAVAASLKAAFHDPYGDGDQTPLAGTECAPLRSARASQGPLDVHQSVLQDFRGSPLHRLAYLGDCEGIRLVIARAKAVGGRGLVWELMEERCSMLRLNALACAVLGSSHARYRLQTEPPGRWEECMDLLVASGANCNARDIAGYPVFALAVERNVIELTSCRLALLLAKAGADLNICTRFGEPILLLPLLDVLASLRIPAVMVARGTKQKLELYEVCVRLGADPDIQDPNGLTARAAADSVSAERASVLEAVRQSALDEQTCASCSKALATMRCKNCFAVFYCGKSCQLRNWPDHKPKCSQIWQDFGVDVDTDNGPMGSVDIHQGLAALRGKIDDVGKVFVVNISQGGPAVRFAQEQEKKRGLPEEPSTAHRSVSSAGNNCVYVYANGQPLGDVVFLSIKDANGNVFMSIPQFVNGEGGTSADVHNFLVRLSEAETGEFAPDGRFYPARWLPPLVEGGPVTVLRICHAKALTRNRFEGHRFRSLCDISKVPSLN